MNSIQQIYEKMGASFLSSPAELEQKLAQIKAFIFDWDGVFNTGEKNGAGSSTFNEVDAMGTTLLRFSYYLNNKQLPITAILSGEKNDSAFYFAQREHFNASYFKIANKKMALDHICSIYNLKSNQIAYFFDDVLDFSIAREVGLRVFIPRKASTLLTNYLITNKLADYICGNESGQYAVRESCEMLLGINKQFEEVIQKRADYDDSYNQYIMARNLQGTFFYTFNNLQIIHVDVKF